MIEEKPLPKKAHRVFKRILDATVEPITVTEMKDFARIDGSDEDTQIGYFIKAARQAAEEFIGRAFLEQTWRMSTDWWGDEAIELPRPPLISVSSVETLDEDGVATAYAASNYYIDTTATPGKLVIRMGASPPTNADRVIAGYRITFVAGYGSTAVSVPEILRHAVKQWAVAIYEGRAMTGDPPPDVMHLLRMFRVR